METNSIVLNTKSRLKKKNGLYINGDCPFCNQVEKDNDQFSKIVT